MQNVIHFLVVVMLVLVLSPTLTAQEYREITGEGNNVNQPHWGASHGDVKRLTPVSFADGISEPGSQDHANPREISNQIFAQDGLINENGGHSDFIWVFGQFIDHDITLIESDASEALNIQVPPCDEHFDPNCTGNSIIPVNRSAAREGSGNSLENPREYSNSITSFIDGSNVYGSDEERAAYLRSFENGKLRTSHGELLPFNTVDGEFNSGRDFTAPEMDMMNPSITKHFVAGDVRANENVLLASMHTLFVREHNRWADLLSLQNPLWSDETIYQEAKLRTVAVMQAITYEEWLPAMGVSIPAYGGYSESVNPSILKVFSAAAFRLGHTMLNDNVNRMLENCEDHPNGDLTLLEAFFNPVMVLQDGGIESLLKGMAAQNMQEIDGKMVDAVRNFLFGAPGSGIGMDLASINIQRGREMGLPDFNTVRRTFGLPPYNSIEEICPDAAVIENLKSLYGTVDNVDPWVGMLCEVHMDDDVMFGRTIMDILKYQFSALRDGDRFYYENEVLLSEEEKAQIKNTRLAEVIKRNSSLRFMQENVFLTEEDCEQTHLDLEPTMLDAVAYPNPVEEELKVGIYATLDANVDVRIIDNLGRPVLLAQDELHEGMNIISIDVSAIQAGAYLLHLSSGAAYNQQQFVKL